MLLRLLLCLPLIILTALPAQDVYARKFGERFYKDDRGIIRDAETGKEAVFFGCNYTLPFAHAYRALERLGVRHEDAVDRDVYHLARLGFNAYRVHLWDVEISDKDGHLLENEHLRLFDYLLSRLKERGFTILITAQTNFGNGYPEPDSRDGGFSYDYEKCSVHVDTAAIAKQERYLYELVSHVNPYTKVSYGNDPAILGFEINNEPCNPGSAEQTREYIDRMAAAIRKTGTRKLIYYNASHNLQNTEAIFASAIDGCTFQWYPSGLVAGHTRKGNFLPNVDDYRIPFDGVRNFDRTTKAVYEFDAADIADSYIYPAMVRTFKSKGFQWITQFSYDPMDMAWANTEYQTHFLNLAYTPAKAVSMRIAARAAREIPVCTRFPKYPADTLFGDFRVSYREKLSEYVTDEVFLYSGTTSSRPRNPALLREIAGFGDSPVVRYDGCGAYFLDKLEDGIWRLEVMPDAVWLSDPFARPSLKKRVARILWNRWDMTLSLPDLGSGFTFRGINAGNEACGKAENGSIGVRPGTYLLAASGKSVENWNAESCWKNIKIGEFVAPAEEDGSFTVLHTPLSCVVKGEPVRVRTTVAASDLPDRVTVQLPYSPWSEHNADPIVMKRIHDYVYEAEIPGKYVHSGTLVYYIVVEKNSRNFTYPSGVETKPADWDFYAPECYSSVVSEADDPIVLYDTTKDYRQMEHYAMGQSLFRASRIRTQNPSVRTTEVRCENLVCADRLVSRIYIGDLLRGVHSRLGRSKELVARLSADGGDRLEIGFVTGEGFTFKAEVIPGIVVTELRVPLNSLRLTDTQLLPAAYPEFLKRTFTPEAGPVFDVRDAEFLEIGTRRVTETKPVSYRIENIWLE